MIRGLLAAVVGLAAPAVFAQAEGQAAPQAPAQDPAQTASAGTEAPSRRPLTLEEAIRIAMERNYDVQRQALLTLSSQQDYVLARAQILPRLDFNASRSATHTAGAPRLDPTTGQIVSTQYSNGYSARLAISQLIFDGGKWWNNWAAADLSVSSNRALLDEQRLQVTYLVEQRFYELIRAQRQLQVLTEAATRSRDQATFVQRLYEGGRATQADVYAARANRDNDEIQRLGAERTVELARADLALGIGTDPAEPLTVVEPQRLFEDPAVPPPPQDAVARALQNRPSLRAASLQVDANRKSATAARGDYWPAISLSGSYNRGTESLPEFTARLDTNRQISGAVNLTWNLFNGFATTAQARKADLQVRLSENDFLNARRNVASDVEKAVAQLGTARAQARVAVQTEQNARENLRLARARQQVGVGTQLEVRDAELKLTQAELSRVAALVDGREAEAALRRAQGG